MIAVRDTIPTTAVKISTALVSSSIEVVSVNLLLRKPITLCCIYIPPCTDDLQLTEVIKHFSTLINSYPRNSLVLVGDFNLPDINWDTLTASSTASRTFCDFIYDNALLQVVDTSTHSKGNILDLIITNSEDSIRDLVIHSCGHRIISDHFTFTFRLSASAPSSSRSSPIYVYDYPKADYNSLCSFLIDFDFTSCLLSHDVDSVWNSIKSAIYEGINLFIPRVRLRRHQYPRWYTPELRHLSKCLHTLRKKVSKKPTSYLRIKLEQQTSALSDKIQSAKSLYESQLVANCAGNCNSKIYDYIRSLSNNSSIPSTVFLNSSSATTDLEKANLFNSFFHSVYNPSQSGTLPLPSSEPIVSYPSIANISFTELEVFSALSSLDPAKSMGVDRIGSKILKQCASALYIPLHHLFSLSISNHAIPLEWKHHSITPIFKSGERSSVSNYRPVSLLCIASKVLERLIYNYLSKFIISNDIISQFQFGFLKYRSTTQQLLVFLDRVYHILNSNDACDVIYLDFKKAFDTVPHLELLSKIWNIGITGNVWLWIREYLTNRVQHVSINGCNSAILPVLSGVPQGSILGPLLFLIFINDLPQYVRYSLSLLFADDTKCLSPISSILDCQLLQSDLDQLSTWSSEWRLLFNESKCSLLSFTSSSSRNASNLFPYYINNREVVACAYHKDLGITMSNDLSWSKHTTQITCNAYRILGLLRRSFSAISSTATKKRLYVSLVRSQLLYGSQIWKPALIKDIRSLEQIQRRATKFILNDNSLDYKSRLMKLHLLPLMMTLELQDILFFVRSLKQSGLQCSSFNILQYISFSTNPTRSGSHRKLIQPIVKTTRHKNFYFNRFPLLWNSLPPIDLDLSYDAIKRKLKDIFWLSFVHNFNSEFPCTFHFCCPCSNCSVVPKSNFQTL